MARKKTPPSSLRSPDAFIQAADTLVTDEIFRKKALTGDVKNFYNPYSKIKDTKLHYLFRLVKIALLYKQDRHDGSKAMYQYLEISYKNTMAGTYKTHLWILSEKAASMQYRLGEESKMAREKEKQPPMIQASLFYQGAGYPKAAQHSNVTTATQ